MAVVLKRFVTVVRIKLSSRTRFIPVNVIVIGHFCWWHELASPAAEVYCFGIGFLILHGRKDDLLTFKISSSGT